MADYTGKIIEYLDGKQIRLGLVLRQATEKLHVQDPGGRQRRVSTRQVILSHSRVAGAAEFGKVAAELEERIGALRREVDTELLWESVRDLTGALELGDLGQEYFGDPDSCQLSALFRAVAEDPARFKQKGLAITARPPEHVAELLEAARRREARDALRRTAVEWMRQTLRSEETTVPIPEELRETVDYLEAFLRREGAAELRPWLEEAAPGRPAPETAFDLLARAGRLAAGTDRFLGVAGIQEAFPERVVAAAEALEPYRPDPGRADFSDQEAFSIDDEETREIDDALTAAAAGENLRVGIHIADVAGFIEKDDILDREAFRRGASIYLPQRTVTMIPGRISRDLASLVEGEFRPCVSFTVELSPEGEILEREIRRGQVKVSRRLTYDEADELIQSESEGFPGTALRRLDAVARQLEERRRRHGALTVRRPELKLRVQGDQIHVKVLDGSSPSQRIVSEMMILANSLAASHGAREDVPIIYRAQDRRAEDVPLPDTYDPVAVDAIFRAMQRSRFSLVPQPHAGLGLDAYTQLTSPIRRFADLVLERQLVAHLAGERLPYEQEELMEVLGSALIVEKENRDLEGRARRFYLLKYLADHQASQSVEAVVVNTLAGGYVVETTDLYVRGRLLGSPGRAPGDRVEVRVETVDPARNVLDFRSS